MPNALDLFIQGKLAFYFGYSYHLPRIEASASVPNFTVNPMPQIDAQQANQVTFANYWVNGVFANSEHVNEAWNFVEFATAKEQAALYLASSRRPPALRDLISDLAGDPELTVFANQVVPSRSWYRGRAPDAAAVIFDEMIAGVIAGELTPAAAISQAASQIQLTL
jgi:ABC-type glycerol-3-phosphate transport system substrate-binding protein